MSASYSRTGVQCVSDCNKDEDYDNDFLRSWCDEDGYDNNNDI